MNNFKFNPTDKAHIYVEASESIIIRGIPYNATAHYYLWDDGQFHLGEQSQQPWQQHKNLYCTRQDDKRFSCDPSESARKSLIVLFDEAVAEWTKNHAADIQQAEVESKKSQKQSRLDKIAEHKTAIEKLEKEVNEINKSMGW